MVQIRNMYHIHKMTTSFKDKKLLIKKNLQIKLPKTFACSLTDVCGIAGQQAAINNKYC